MITIMHTDTDGKLSQDSIGCSTLQKNGTETWKWEYPAGPYVYLTDTGNGWVINEFTKEGEKRNTIEINYSMEQVLHVMFKVGAMNGNCKVFKEIGKE